MRGPLGMTSDDDLEPDEEVDVACGLTLCGTSSGTATLVIGDGALPDGAETSSGGSHERTLMVLRGPCCLSLRATIDACEAVDGIVVVREPGRIVTNRDVTEITGLPVVAEPDVA